MKSNHQKQPAIDERYTIGEVVAQSALGFTLRGREKTSGRTVALRQMHPALLSEATAVERFVAEAKRTALLEHPNVIPVHEVSANAEEAPFFTTKFVRGYTLADVLAQLSQQAPNEPCAYPLGFLLTTFQKVCDAVAFAHSKGTMHCGLSTENIMLGSYGEVLLSDWSEAVETGPHDEDDYQRRDVHSLGAILYELLTLTPAFEGGQIGLDRGDAPVAPEDRVVKQRLSHLPDGKIPASLSAVVMKALAPSAADRYQRVEDLQADVRAYQNGFATAAEYAGPLRQIWLFIKRHQRVSAVVAGCVVLVAGVGLAYAFGVIRAAGIADAERLDAIAALRETELETRTTETALARLSKVGPDFVSNAREFMKEGRFDEALQFLGYAVDVDRGNADYQLARAHLLQASQRLAEAAEGYRRVLEIRPDSSAKTNLQLSEEILREQGESPILNPGLRKRLAEAIIVQGRAEQAPKVLFRTD